MHIQVHFPRWLLGVLAAGCFLSPSATAWAADLTGHWAGHWEDCRSGHCGPLRADFCKCDDKHYRVTFAGRFFRVIPFRYTVVLTVTEQDENKVKLAGESNLGRLAGTFTYSAEATAAEFRADYSSCRYEGKFILKKCCP